MKRTVGLIVGLLAVLVGCVASKSTLQTSLAGSSLNPLIEDSKVYFVPMGDFPAEQLEPLVQFYRQRFGIEVSVLRNVPIDESTRDSARQQIVAEKLLGALQKSASGYVNDRKAILIGFTSEDLYPASQNWQFCFGWRDATAHTAVVSTARLNLRRESAPFAADISASRLRKVVTKDVGMLYFGLPQNGNPKSVMYEFVVGIDDLDQVGDDF